MSFGVWVQVPFLGPYGEVAEWFKATVLKTVEGNASVGSNPTLPAICTLSIVGIMQWPYKPKRLGSSPRGCTKATAVA